jgi:hypothetical protein
MDFILFGICWSVFFFIASVILFMREEFFVDKFYEEGISSERKDQILKNRKMCKICGIFCFVISLGFFPFFSIIGM